MRPEATNLGDRPDRGLSVGRRDSFDERLDQAIGAQLGRAVASIACAPEGDLATMRRRCGRLVRDHALDITAVAFGLVEAESSHGIGDIELRLVLERN